jgi:hypothetical protein
VFVYYTPKEANKVLPEVKRKFDLIIATQNQILIMQEVLQHTLDFDGSFEKYVLKKQELNTTMSNLYKTIEDLESMGVILKSVDEGLLDFPSLKFTAEVWLCWKDGEDEVKFWHGKHEGFTGRKPIPISDESLV